jgi:hypothetical protein
MPSGLAVVISTASAAIRSALGHLRFFATSQPPVFGTPTKLRLGDVADLRGHVEGRGDLERLLLDA